jgi:hypothetical protein
MAFAPGLSTLFVSFRYAKMVCRSQWLRMSTHACRLQWGHGVGDMQRKGGQVGWQHGVQRELSNLRETIEGIQKVKLVCQMLWQRVGFKDSELDSVLVSSTAN